MSWDCAGGCAATLVPRGLPLTWDGVQAAQRTIVVLFCGAVAIVRTVHLVWKSRHHLVCESFIHCNIMMTLCDFLFVARFFVRAKAIPHFALAMGLMGSTGLGDHSVGFKVSRFLEF